MYVNKLLCKKWLEDPLINPKTGRPIVKNGNIYNQWKKMSEECGFNTKYIKPKKLNQSSYTNLLKNPTINPLTGRKINPDGVTYKKLLKLAEEFVSTTNQQLHFIGDYYLPDKNGLVPVTIRKKTIYALRLVNTDKYKYNVYSSHNHILKTKITTLAHYTMTWDYIYNKCAMIFPSSPTETHKQYYKVIKLSNSNDSTSYTDYINNLLVNTGFVNPTPVKCKTADSLYNKVYGFISQI
jgi:hypothetical protein